MKLTNKIDKTMNLPEFVFKAEALIDQFQELINTMPYKGDTCSESQTVCFQNALDVLSCIVNGTTEKDFIE